MFENKSWLLAALTIILISAFGCRPRAKLPEFNSQAWIADAFACQSVRSKLVPELEKIRLEIRGLTTSQVIELLGKPDGEGLLASNGRIYYYYVAAGRQCQDRQTLSAANKLQVRFNALEQASEVNFEQPIF